MRNAANKMTNPIDPCTENHFWSFIEISEQNGSLCGFHCGSLWLSFVQKALARLATSQLHSRSLSHSGTDMWISAFKIFSLPVPSRPATRSFCHYPTRSRPEVKNHYPSVSAHTTQFGQNLVSDWMRIFESTDISPSTSAVTLLKRSQYQDAMFWTSRLSLFILCPIMLSQM